MDPMLVARVAEAGTVCAIRASDAVLPSESTVRRDGHSHLSVHAPGLIPPSRCLDDQRGDIVEVHTLQSLQLLHLVHSYLASARGSILWLAVIWFHPVASVGVVEMGLPQSLPRSFSYCCSCSAFYSRCLVVLDVKQKHDNVKSKPLRYAASKSIKMARGWREHAYSCCCCCSHSNQ